MSSPLDERLMCVCTIKLEPSYNESISDVIVNRSWTAEQIVFDNPSLAELNRAPARADAE